MSTNDNMSAILDEIISLSSPRTPRPGDFTALDYQSRLRTTQSTTISLSAVRSRLMKLVEANLLSTCIGLVNGKRTRLWWKKEEIRGIVREVVPLEPLQFPDEYYTDTTTHTHAIPPITPTE